MFINHQAAPARVAISVIPVLIMLNLNNSVTGRLPPLETFTWLTSFILVIQLLSIVSVFGYGLTCKFLVSEDAAAKKFQGILAVVAAVKAKASEALLPCERQDDPQLSAPLDRTLRVEPVKPETPEQKPNTTIGELPPWICTIFQLDRQEDISSKSLRQTLRGLGVFMSLKDVQTMCSAVSDKDKLSHRELLLLLSDFQQHVPKPATASIWDGPRSYLVDLLLRWGYLASLVIAVLSWSIAAFSYQ